MGKIGFELDEIYTRGYRVEQRHDPNKRRKAPVCPEYAPVSPGKLSDPALSLFPEHPE